MSDFNFKVGDKVYYPIISNKVLTLAQDEGSKYPFTITLQSGEFRSFMADGKYYRYDVNSSIFPATQEWYEKLVVIYPNLEPPPKPKEPIDVIIAMLEGGYNEVCLKAPITGYEIVGNPTHARNACHTVKRFKPYCLKKGKYIVDFIDGKCILESENDIS